MEVGTPSQLEPPPLPLSGPSVTQSAIAAGRFTPRGTETVRSRAARGTVITAAFMVVVTAVGMLKGYVVAAFLPASQYGVWGLLVITLGTLYWLAELGFGDKYIQQEDADQEKAFQIAFTLQCMLVLAFMVLALVAMPLFALAYGRWDILAPGYAIGLLVMPAVALQTPLWIFYRRMEFAKQRLLQSIDPLVGFVVTVALAVAGLGYWSLVIGLIASSWAAAAAAVRACPYRLTLRYERGTLREYLGFSGPLFVSSLSAIAIAQVPVLVVQRSIGVAAVGAITLAGTITLYTTRMDDVLSHSLYATICAGRDRLDLLFESFSKTNRMALLWALPVGVGLALFAHPLVHFVLGDRWRSAIIVIQVLSVNAAVNQIGFNWASFYRARGDTRPTAIASVALLVATLGLAVPLLLLDGLRGYAVGMALATLIFVGVRLHYVRRLFPGFRLLGHLTRATVPTVPATAAVLAMRLLGAPFTATWAMVEVVAFTVLVLGTTLVTERALLREFVGYLRG